MIYVEIFLCCCLFVVLENARQNTGFITKYGQVFLTIFLILFVGFRLVGADYGSYETMYLNGGNAGTYIEPFFTYTMKFFNDREWPFTTYTFVIAALSICLKMYTIKKYSPYFFLTVVIGLPVIFIGDMGQMRFSLAIATLLLSIPYCLDRDPVRFGLIVFLAASMHISAVVFVFAYFIPTLKIDYFLMLLIWLGCFILSHIIDNTFISRMVDTFAENSMVDLKVSSYLNDVDQAFVGKIVYTFQGIFFRLLTLGLIFYVPTDREKLKSFLINIYFFGNCVFFLFGFNEIMALRTSLYYTCFEVIAIPFVLYEVRGRLTFWTLLSLFVIRAFYQGYSLLYEQYEFAYFPYRNALMNLW